MGESLCARLWFSESIFSNESFHKTDFQWTSDHYARKPVYRNIICWYWFQTFERMWENNV